MQSSASWLTKLKATELHRLAIRIGTPCSGTKPVVTKGIQDALLLLPNHGLPEHRRREHNPDAQRILSIDMGIRNLAYSLWTSPATYTTTEGYPRRDRPTLKAWKKVDISTPNSSTSAAESVSGVLERTEDIARLGRGSFEPIDYADRAYTLIKHLLDMHNPSHILIERQRFRSGGNANVQEWTIRVGVFEGMLYAVLRTLAASRKQGNPLIVEPTLPARVNRYWFEDTPDSTTGRKAKKAKLTSRDMKKAKIELVRQYLYAAKEHSEVRLFEIDESVMSLAQAFAHNTTSANKGAQASKKTRPTENQTVTSNISKLDDLADSLLQGLAWIHWQNNRLKLQALKERAFKQNKD